jgi:hypothetical protein
VYTPLVGPIVIFEDTNCKELATIDIFAAPIYKHAAIPELPI